MSSPKQVYSTPANSLVNGVTTGYSLFPITSGYSAWAGDCLGPVTRMIRKSGDRFSDQIMRQHQ